MNDDRRTYYNPMLDPHCQAKMTPAMLAAVLDDQYESGGPLNEPDGHHPANLVSSLCLDGLHRPALDIDIPCRYVASSTPGHGHIYLDHLPMEWETYKVFLYCLVGFGVIEKAYADHSVARGQTLLRPPGVPKFVALMEPAA
jgi:hypothetical protein